MTKTFELLKRATATLVSTAFMLGLLFVVSCDDGGDDPEPELYDLSGVYTFNKAILKTEITMPFELVPGFPIKVPANTDITDEMAGGLLEEAPCDNPENGAVELKANNQLFFTCIGEDNAEQAGTWEVNSDSTELTLILSVAVGTLNLKIQELDIDETNDIIGGTIGNFPITKTLLAGFMAGFGLTEQQIEATLAGVDDNWVALVDVEIEFKKEGAS
jgi:hypothetical protein